jgi:hypothetical protein
MKNFKTVSIFTLIFIAAGLSGCEVEFNPNSQWQETPVIYCMLDQDADTTFARIEKAFLGEGNYLEFAKIKDSVYYKEDEIEVKMIAYNQNDKQFNNPLETFTFNYTYDYKKDTGVFVSENAPIYYCVTKNRIRPECVYKLVMKNLRTGHEAFGTAQPIADYDTYGFDGRFNLKTEGNDMMKTVEWWNMNTNVVGTMAKLFQLTVRFHYLENGAEAFVDLPCGKTLNTYNNAGHKLSGVISLNGMISTIKSKLNYPAQREMNALKIVWLELFITSCDLNMYDYISLNQSSGNSLTETPLLTNIENGVGLFAARRTGESVKRSFTDYNYVATTKFVEKLKAINVGF